MKPNGRALFKANCGVCHRLADAGTTASVGPDLDNAQPPVAKVKLRVTDGGGVMPSFKGKLTAAQIDAVGHYVNGVSKGPPRN
ncbi:MAG: quinohemoprotein ethanol dehydrogenase [Gaiellaceae bacterium]|nr:quinohemoprotein ethanol dehydrogenase [Gaiellaceae bacterium]